jgi:DNA-binding NtrC family response regulator
MKPRDEEEQRTVLRRLPPRDEISAYAVQVEVGPDAGAQLVIDGRVEGGPALIGKSAICHLRLTDPTVSRRHLSLAPHGGALRVCDLSSSNGTVVDGVSVLDAVLRGGEAIVIGGTTLRVRVVDKATPPAESAELGFGRVVGRSRAMRRLYPMLQRLAASTVPVVIEGETGTGKELLAEALHETGMRARGPFVVFDCTAVPPSLVEAALFGHERGAFTGATEARKGVFEQAHGGTLLIDEIGDLELPLQAKLLRAIERSEIRRVGGEKWIRVDVRVLAATRRDLDREVAEGRFRDDLYYRLAVARVELPPLRAREGDVRLLAETFWGALGGVGPLPESLAAKLERYPWPGNVRELSNAVARHAALGDLADAHPPRGATRVRDAGPEAGVDDDREARAPEDVIADVIAQGLPLVAARRAVVEAFERRYVEALLARHGGNVSKAAAAAGVARRNFQLVKAKQRS